MKIKIIGGLGNQMFQYASAYAISKELNEELIVDISDAIKYKVHPLRLIELSIDAKYQRKCSLFERLIFKINFPFMKKIRSKFFYIENNLLHDDGILINVKNKKMIGYFQSEKYFIKYRTDLLCQFIPKGDFSSYQINIMDDIKKSNNVSLHIRRGDYLSNSEALKTHGLCNIDYFNRAVEYLVKDNKIDSKTKFFIFSDDIEWCKENISFNYEMIFVLGDEMAPEKDMYLMSLCDHNIISNSTFSWWGAWMNTNQNKSVIAPEVWFKNGMENEIVPESWIKL